MIHELLKKILKGKRTMRKKLANRPIVEKLAMLDAMRDRARTLQQSALRRTAGIVQGQKMVYGSKRDME